MLRCSSALKRCSRRPAWNSSCSHRRSSESDTCANSAPTGRSRCTPAAPGSRAASCAWAPRSVRLPVIEFGVEVGRRSSPKYSRSSTRGRGRCMRPQRIELGDQVPAVDPDLDRGARPRPAWHSPPASYPKQRRPRRARGSPRAPQAAGSRHCPRSRRSGLRNSRARARGRFADRAGTHRTGARGIRRSRRTGQWVPAWEKNVRRDISLTQSDRRRRNAPGGVCASSD